MSKAHERKESRKGLIAITREDVKWGEHGFEIEETEPGQFVLKAPDPREMIRSLMGALKEIADETITAAGKDPAQWARIKRESDHADPAYVAARLNDDLWAIQNAINTVTRAKDIDEARWHAYDAVQKALAACFTYHALGVIEHEVGIVAHGQSVDGAKRAKAEQAKIRKQRDVRLAREYQARSPHPRWKPSVLMAEIGKSVGLSRSASIDAIKRGLQKLSG